jgi:tetratricopeptide (TPR) repeat protein
MGLWLLVLVFGGTAFAQNSFSRGEELFMQNRPTEALPLLESAAAEDPANLTASLYLGITYLQLGRTDEAIAVYTKILPRGGTETPRIAYNLGNAYYGAGNTVLAAQYYTQAIEANPAYASAYLNRANTRVRAGTLQDAVADYTYYLILEPRSPKRPQIERLISFITEESAAEERRKLMAEAQAKEAAERRQRLLEEVSSSLQSAAEASQGLSAGTEDVLGYDGEFELE